MKTIPDFFKTKDCHRSDNPDGSVIFSGKVKLTEKPMSVKVNQVDLDAYDNGAEFDEVFPYLSKEEREFMLRGMSQDGWDMIFGKKRKEDCV